MCWQIEDQADLCASVQHVETSYSTRMKNNDQNDRFPTGGSNAMIRAKLFNGDGYVTQAARQGEKPKYSKKGYRWADEQKDIDFCLNCTKEKCKYGICERYKNRWAE